MNPWAFVRITKDDQLDSTEKLVMFVLATHDSAELGSFPSYSTLEAEGKIARATVSRAIKGLKRKRRIKYRKGGNRKGRNWANKYELYPEENGSRFAAPLDEGSSSAIELPVGSPLNSKAKEVGEKSAKTSTSDTATMPRLSAEIESSTPLASFASASSAHSANTGETPHATFAASADAAAHYASDGSVTLSSAELEEKAKEEKRIAQEQHDREWQEQLRSEAFRLADMPESSRTQLMRWPTVAFWRTFNLKRFTNGEIWHCAIDHGYIVQIEGDKWIGINRVAHDEDSSKEEE
jgi:hypothetical protein